MKILHVVSSLNVGGAERFVIDLAYQQHKKEDVQIDILNMGKQGEPLEKELTSQKVIVHFETRILMLRKLLLRYDIVNVHSSHCLLRVLLASIGQKHCKIVYTRHNEKVHTSFKWRITYALARYKLHRMIFVAQKAQDLYLLKYPKFKTKAVVILNGVLPISTHKIASDKIRLGHIGRFVPLKAQSHLIEAIANLTKEERSHLNVNYFGTGDALLLTCQNLAQKLIPELDVVFSGFVSDRNAIFENIDILIVTSETEGLSLAILEALASGTPIIATNVGGNPELVHENKNGFLYSFNDYKTLAQLIIKLSSDESLCKRFTQYGQQLYAEKFSMQRCSAEYIVVYKS